MYQTEWIIAKFRIQKITNLFVNSFSVLLIAASISVLPSVHFGLLPYAATVSSVTSETRRLLKMTSRARRLSRSSVQISGDGSVSSFLVACEHLLTTKSRKWTRSLAHGISLFMLISLRFFFFWAILFTRLFHSESKRSLKSCASSFLFASPERIAAPTLTNTIWPRWLPSLEANVYEVLSSNDMAFAARITASKLLHVSREEKDGIGFTFLHSVSSLAKVLTRWLTLWMSFVCCTSAGPRLSNSRDAYRISRLSDLTTAVMSSSCILLNSCWRVWSSVSPITLRSNISPLRM